MMLINSATSPCPTPTRNSLHCTQLTQGKLLQRIKAKRASGHLRLLIQAPSGSGKTLVCVKLVAELAADELEQHNDDDFFAPAPAADDWAVLLLTHSAALAQQTAEEVAVELETRTGVAVKGSPVGVEACPAGHGIAVHVTGSPEVQVHIMTIDGLIDAVDAAAGKRETGLRYRHAVVDEGHEVFSYQPYAWLVGQHRYKNPRDVLDVLDRVLTEPPTAASVVVFHDKSYQHVCAGRPTLVWPDEYIETRIPLPIVRNPGSVRDASIPFSSELQTKNLALTQGRTKYFRAIDDLIDVGGAAVRRTPSGRSTSSGVRMVEVEVCPRRMTNHHQLQTSKYAVQVAAELERIRRDLSEVGQPCWAACTAVVIPGCPEELAGTLLESTRVEARAKGFKEVEAALPLMASEFHHDALYFGSIENLAGLERPFVVQTGMQHPAYIAHRVENENWDPIEHNRIDARAYIGITRCTVELTVVEVKCEQYALHFGISGAGGEGTVSLIGDPFHEGEARRAYVSGGIVTAGVTVNLKSPPDAQVLATAVSLRMETVTSDLWASSRFRWAQCVEGVHELNMSRSCRADDKDCNVLANINLWRLHEHLEVLYLNENGFADLPPELGKLTSLKQLYLYENELASVPAELGRLTKLERLRMDKNKLASVPSELGQLTALDRLYLDHNKLSSLPAELGCLTQLTRLTLHCNELASVPPELGKLTKLTALNLSDNNLSSVPPELGLLTKLKALNLSHNQLASVPPELGLLTKLTQLRLDKNRLHGFNSLPGQIGQLSLLTELRLDENQLTALPAELGQLTKLTSLYVYMNMLESVPPQLGQLSSLTVLLLDHNQLLSVPSELGQLAKLKTLNLSDNQLSSVPAEIGQLTLLASLNLSHNKLTSVPPEFGQLTELKHLHVQANIITSIPPWVESLEHLKKFEVDDGAVDGDAILQRLRERRVNVKEYPRESALGAKLPPLEEVRLTSAPQAPAIGSAAFVVMIACLAVLLASWVTQ
jgi:leucine-rich repeat protein SHOC2